MVVEDPGTLEFAWGVGGEGIDVFAGTDWNRNFLLASRFKHNSRTSSLIGGTVSGY